MIKDEGCLISEGAAGVWKSNVERVRGVTSKMSNSPNFQTGGRSDPNRQTGALGGIFRTQKHGIDAFAIFQNRKRVRDDCDCWKPQQYVSIHCPLRKLCSFLLSSDPGWGRETERHLSSSGLSLHEESDGVPLSCTREDHQSKNLPSWRRKWG